MHARERTYGCVRAQAKDRRAESYRAAGTSRWARRKSRKKREGEKKKLQPPLLESARRAETASELQCTRTFTLFVDDPVSCAINRITFTQQRLSLNETASLRVAQTEADFLTAAEMKQDNVRLQLLTVCVFISITQAPQLEETATLCTELGNAPGDFSPRQNIEALKTLQYEHTVIGVPILVNTSQPRGGFQQSVNVLSQSAERVLIKLAQQFLVFLLTPVLDFQRVSETGITAVCVYCEGGLMAGTCDEVEDRAGCHNRDLRVV
ncbi:hypothetical protein EXN66_Car014307 [Channa argus]|uniref:Uncharacterized protein n=1 Tax=Channa argus TaxID=215402 RepID=A0A6G1Q7K2_CHAAH|nr:hypothetical protein EXN66_Car014307 [Channa argus]